MTRADMDGSSSGAEQGGMSEVEEMVQVSRTLLQEEREIRCVRDSVDTSMCISQSVEYETNTYMYIRCKYCATVSPYEEVNFMVISRLVFF